MTLMGHISSLCHGDWGCSEFALMETSDSRQVTVNIRIDEQASDSDVIQAVHILI